MRSGRRRDRRDRDAAPVGHDGERHRVPALVEHDGEHVQRGRTVDEIETDKAAMTYESDSEGVLMTVTTRATRWLSASNARIGEATGDASTPHNGSAGPGNTSAMPDTPSGQAAPSGEVDHGPPPWTPSTRRLPWRPSKNAGDRPTAPFPRPHGQERVKASSAGQAHRARDGGEGEGAHREQTGRRIAREANIEVAGWSTASATPVAVEPSSVASPAFRLTRSVHQSKTLRAPRARPPSSSCSARSARSPGAWPSPRRRSPTSRSRPTSTWSVVWRCAPS